MRRAAFTLSFVLLIAAFGGAYLFFQKLTRGFPELAIGTYTGALQYEGDARGTPWLIDKLPEGGKILVAVGEPQLPAQIVPLHADGAADGLPLIVSADGIRLRFVGRVTEDERLRGEFENPISGKTGTWWLAKAQSSGIGDSAEADLQAWTVLENELRTTEAQIESAQKTFDIHQAKLDRLSRFMVDEDSLREKANSRYDAASGALSGSRAKLDQLRTELDATIRNVELSQRISPRGRLALLSRETLQRESRWVEISLNLLAPQTAPDFERSLERANKIRQIMDEIHTERRRIAELQARERYVGREEETSAEEEFYRELQE